MQIQFTRLSGMLIFYALIQIFMALGIIVGFSYMFESPDPNSKLFLATGAPTFIVIMTGLVVVPMEIAKAKAAGYVDFTRTWPVSRLVILIVDTLIWLAVMVPSLIISTTVAYLFMDPGYDVSWTILIGFILSGVAAICIGYGFSYLLSDEFTFTLSQVIAFGALMFSPLNYPIERLPEWLQIVHKILPIESMAQVMRNALAKSIFDVSIQNYVTLTVWAVLGFAGALYVLNTRRK